MKTWGSSHPPPAARKLSAQFEVGPQSSTERGTHLQQETCPILCIWVHHMGWLAPQGHPSLSTDHSRSQDDSLAVSSETERRWDELVQGDWEHAAPLASNLIASSLSWGREHEAQNIQQVSPAFFIGVGQHGKRQAVADMLFLSQNQISSHDQDLQRGQGPPKILPRD